MLKEFLTALDTEKLFGELAFKPNQIGSQIAHYDAATTDLNQYQLALIGVIDSRGNLANEGCAMGALHFRKEFYKLFIPSVDLPFKMIDMGNINAGEQIRDTHFALATIMLELMRHKIVPIIIGGSHDITYGQFLSYQEFYTMINLVVVDEKIDIEEPEGGLEANSYLMPILAHQPNYLFNYSHIGYQTYLNDPNAVEMLSSLNFDCYRLGMIRKNLEEVEPVLRDADLLSIDMNAVRMADSPAHSDASPNGFSAEELCQIARYAGISDKLTSFGIYEFNPDFDTVNQPSAKLVAQMVWCFADGYYNRKNDYPSDLSNYQKFTVKMNDVEHELIFWKSKKTDRWWMEIPHGDKKKYEKQQMVPCSFADYELACKEELPDRWMRVYTKLIEI